MVIIQDFFIFYYFFCQKRSPLPQYTKYLPLMYRMCYSRISSLLRFPAGNFRIQSKAVSFGPDLSPGSENHHRAVEQRSLTKKKFCNYSCRYTSKGGTALCSEMHISEDCSSSCSQARCRPAFTLSASQDPFQVLLLKSKIQ